MIKMREAFEKAWNTDVIEFAGLTKKQIAWSAWQAAIADVKAGGAQAWIEHHKGGDNLNWEQWDHPNKPATPLYKLPEDK